MKKIAITILCVIMIPIISVKRIDAIGLNSDTGKLKYVNPMALEDITTYSRYVEVNTSDISGIMRFYMKESYNTATKKWVLSGYGIYSYSLVGRNDQKGKEFKVRILYTDGKIGQPIVDGLTITYEVYRSDNTPFIRSAVTIQ